jgi:hypothetical protein
MNLVSREYYDHTEKNIDKELYEEKIIESDEDIYV